MESINSWINEDEVRKLAEELTAAPVEKKQVQESQTDDNDGFAVIKKQVEVPKIPVVKSEIPQAFLDKNSNSLAEASAMAASVGLIGKVSKPMESSTGMPIIGADHYLDSVPVCIDENARFSVPSLHPDKRMGTFEEIDIQLTKTVKAKGICVIDRDGDVLYSSLKNQNLLAFIVETMMGSKLMQTQEGEFGNIRIKMSAGEYLEFISVKSTRGVLILAVSMEHVLGNTNAQYVASDVLKIADLV